MPSLSYYIIIIPPLSVWSTATNMNGPGAPVFDASGFLQYNGMRLIWLPAHLRGREIASFNNVSVIGSPGGAITFVWILANSLNIQAYP